MSSLDAKNAKAENYTYQLLAPNTCGLIKQFANVGANHIEHSNFVSGMQRLRGKCYAKDGAITATTLDSEGRFVMRDDEHAWHLLLLQGTSVVGCVRYLLHGPKTAFADLHISSAAISRDPVWGQPVKRAIERELLYAVDNCLSYVEVGGWALAEDWRHTRAAFDMLVASYALGSIWGGCTGCCTATVRHSSSSMLRRVGGLSLVDEGLEIPPYKDPAYGCEMELLKFDYRSPALRFNPLIKPLITQLSQSRVITASSVEPDDFSLTIANLREALEFSYGASTLVTEEIEVCA